MTFPLRILRHFNTCTHKRLLNKMKFGWNHFLYGHWSIFWQTLLSSFLELQSTLTDEAACVENCCQKGIIDRPNLCFRCNHPVKPGPRCTLCCRRSDCTCSCPDKCQKCDSVTVNQETRIETRLQHAISTSGLGVEFERSTFRESIFQSCKVPKHELMHSMWLWLNKGPSTTAAVMLQWDETTLASW